MRAHIVVAAVLAAMAAQPAQAGSVAGTGGSTEVTQLMNNVQLAKSYAQQVLSYENQLMQYATMIQNLKNNPLGVLAPDLDKAINDASRLWSVGKNIASSMSQVDKTFADTFNSPIAKGFSDKFSDWNKSSMDGLKSAMLNAGLQRENFKSDSESLKTLVDSVSKVDGAVSGLQALGSLNAAQIQEAIKLRDLISQQQVAQDTYLAAQSSKQQAVKDQNDKIMTFQKMEMPSL